jgi:hypothetical protein
VRGTGASRKLLLRLGLGARYPNKVVRVERTEHGTFLASPCTAGQDPSEFAAEVQNAVTLRCPPAPVSRGNAIEDAAASWVGRTRTYQAVSEAEHGGEKEADRRWGEG